MRMEGIRGYRAQLPQGFSVRNDWRKIASAWWTRPSIQQQPPGAPSLKDVESDGNGPELEVASPSQFLQIGEINSNNMKMNKNEKVYYSK